MQLLRAPDFSATIAMGLAWLAVALSLSLVLQAIFQSQFSKSISPEISCTLPIEVVEGGISRLACSHTSIPMACSNLKPGDRVILDHPAHCRIERAGMQASMRLVASLQLDVNRVSAQDLTLLKGIGPALSAAIVAHRDASGPLQKLDGLLEVRGIGKKRLNGLRKYLTCAKP